MVVFPNAKINLGLNVLRKRGDGYHDISTVFVPYKGLSDVLEVHLLVQSFIDITLMKISMSHYPKHHASIGFP